MVVRRLSLAMTATARGIRFGQIGHHPMLSERCQYGIVVNRDCGYHLFVPK